ncbi:MAG: hypothetical protein R2823_09410 [Acidimicrobiia bacterium]
MTRAVLVSIAIATIVAVSLAASAALADGVGAAPESLDFTLTRDGSDTRTLTLISDPETATSVHLAVTGQAAPWITLTGPESNDPVEVVTADANGRAAIEVAVTPPADVNNGVYVAEIRVFTTDSPIQAAVIVPVGIEIVGDAAISGALEVAAVPETVAEGSDLPVAVTVRNTGTVRVRPTLELSLTQGTETLATSRTEFDELAPGRVGDFVAVVEQPAAVGETVGLHLVLRFDQVEVARGTVSVEVVAAGGRSQAIIPGTIELIDRADPGGVARLVATFSNAGTGPVDARFVGSVSRDGEVAGPVESIHVTARPGVTDAVDLFVPIEAEGAYSIEGQWVSGGDPSGDPIIYEWSVGGGRALVPIAIAAIGVGLVLAVLSLRTAGRKPSVEPINDEIGVKAR